MEPIAKQIRPEDLYSPEDLGTETAFRRRRDARRGLDGVRRDSRSPVRVDETWKFGVQFVSTLVVSSMGCP